jgi:hypothetical protein
MSTTHIINWKQAANSRGLKYLIEPGTIYPGDTFTVSIFDPQQYRLISLYGGLSDKSLAIVNDEKTELIAINAQPEFPIAVLTGVVAGLPIINADNRTVSESAGANLAAKVSVVDSQLQWSFDFSKGYGSANLRYKTYPAQVWTHDGMESPGQAVLFAQNLDTLEYTEIPITISSRDSNSADNVNLEIVAVAAPSHFGWNGIYARLNVLPAALNPTVFTKVGRVEKNGTVRHTVVGEKISLDGSGVINTKFPPVALKNYIGLFYDAKDNPKSSCNPFISGTGLSCEKGVFGELTISYETMAQQYDYYAETSGNLLTGFIERIGPVMAVKGKKSVVFEIPPPTLAIAKKQEVLTVYFEKAVNEQGEWELPPNIKANPPVASYPKTVFASSRLMKTWNFVTAKVPVETVMSDGTFFSTDSNLYAAETSLQPFLGNQKNPDRKYLIEKKVPDEFTQSQIDEINKAEIELKKKWGIG